MNSTESIEVIKNIFNCYRPQTKFAKVMFLYLSVSHSVHRGGSVHGTGGMCGGGHAWQDHTCPLPCIHPWEGGMCGGRGACVVGGGHVWWEGGMCGGRGHVWLGGMHGRGVGRRGALMMGGYVGACVVGAMHGKGACVAGWCACHVHPPDTTRYGRSMRGQYTSYWNAFLFWKWKLLKLVLYKFDRSCRILFLVILKMKITENSFLQIL